MSRTHPPRLPPLILLALCGWTLGAAAQPLGTAFTYQGQLTESGQPANGLYDLQFCLFDSPGTPVTLACAPDFNDVPVETGQFTVALDFGATPFNGQQRWLELRVRPGAGTAGYTILAPRQLIRAVPEALRASAASAAPWAGLTGVPPGFADGVDDTGSGGTVTSVTAGTGLSGGTITGSGTIGIANGGVGAAQIAGGAVGATQIAAGAVGSVQLADGGIAAIDVAPDALGAAQLAANAVGAAELADAAVDTASLQDAAVTQPKIAAGAVGAAQIAAGAVGLAQIDTNQVQRRVAGVCPLGAYLRGLLANGTPVCSDLPGVSVVTAVEPATYGFAPSIALGADGLPIIAHITNTGNRLVVSKCSDNACANGSTRTIIDAAGSGLRNPDLAIGADGLPVVSYTGAGFDGSELRVLKCTNAACSTAPLIRVVDGSATAFVGERSSIAIGSDGIPVIAYYNSTATALKVAKCANSTCGGTATITTVDDPAGSDVGSATSIAVPSDGRPVIAYHDATAGTLKLARCANAACTGAASIVVVDDPPANTVATFLDLTIGADLLPIIAYIDSTANTLKVAKCLNADCTSTTITTIPNQPLPTYRYATIAIGSDSLPVIGYAANDGAYPYPLVVVKCADLGCTTIPSTTRIDTAPTDDLSLAITSDGLPIFASGQGPGGQVPSGLYVTKCGTRTCR